MTAVRAGVPDERPQRLDGDAIAAVAILLFAAADVHGWLSDFWLASILLRVVWVVTYVAAVRQLMRRFGAEWLTSTVRQEPILCVLLTLAAVSCVWSLAPLLTLQKAASLCGTTALGVFVAYAVPQRQTVRVLYWTFALLIVSSLIVGSLFPTPVADSLKPGWIGIMSHRNSFGAAAAFAAVFFLIVTVSQSVHRLGAAMLCVASLFGVVASRSRTAEAALAVMLGTCAYFALAWDTGRPERTTIRRGALGVVLAVTLVPLVMGLFASAFGDDDPFNGRSRIWQGAVAIMRERPLTGYGYAAVWGRGTATLLPQVPITAHRSATNAHNSILQVATELGIPAALAACIYLYGAISSAAWLFVPQPSILALFAVEFLVGIAVMGYAEAHLMQIHSFFWILLVATTVTVRRSLVAVDARAPSGSDADRVGARTGDGRLVDTLGTMR